MIRSIKKAAARILGIIVLLFGVTFLSFSLMYLAPGDPAESILRAGGSMPSQEDIIEKRIEMGLDRPFLEQYGSWLNQFMHGDLGVSMIDGTDVTSQLLEGLSNSMLLAVFCLFLGILTAFPIGVYSAVKKDRIFDKITSIIVFIRLSTPSFLLGLVLLYVFAYKLKMVSVAAGSSGLAGIVLPVLTLGSGISVRMIRQIRSAVLQELRQLYVDGARSRGISEQRILFFHVLKNIMLPIITLLALSFGELLGGTAVTETIFSWPGIGRLVLEAIDERDYTIVQGFVVMIALIFCVVYGLTELSYGIFDPRVRSAQIQKRREHEKKHEKKKSADV
ncbi:MAG: ABC transporter permease [Ruminococcus sp.]